MWGLEITRDAASVVDAARDLELLINRTSSNVIRLLPPYTITTDEAARALERLGPAIRAGKPS
jgi:acetylornithine/succinyldiaminopimelate/putrescine aminotransferase